MAIAGQRDPQHDEGTLDAGAFVLVDAVARLSAAKTAEEIQDIVGRAARAMTGADGATVVMREGDQCHYVDEDAVTPLWKGQRFPLEACVSGWTMLHRRPARVPDIFADDRIPVDAYRPTFVRSLAMVPIRSADPIGAIGNYWAYEHSVTDEQLALLQALADSTAVAIESLAVWGRLEDRVMERTAELVAAAERSERLLRTVAHEVRNPLLAADGLLELANSGHAGQQLRDDIIGARECIADGVRILSVQLDALRTLDRTTLEMQAEWF